MVRVTKVEKEAILKSFPNAHIRRTMKRKSERHHYFCEESEKIIEFLNAYRIDRSMCVEGRCKI